MNTEVVTDVETGDNHHLIDPRYQPPSAATVARWLNWCAPVGDPDAGTLSDDHGD